MLYRGSTESEQNNLSFSHYFVEAGGLVPKQQHQHHHQQQQQQQQTVLITSTTTTKILTISGLLLVLLLEVVGACRLVPKVQHDYLPDQQHIRQNLPNFT